VHVDAIEDRLERLQALLQQPVPGVAIAEALYDVYACDAHCTRGSCRTAEARGTSRVAAARVAAQRVPSNRGRRVRVTAARSCPLASSKAARCNFLTGYRIMANIGRNPIS